SLALAEALSLPEQEKIEVGVAGLLHDVGKTQLALDLIRKPGTLTVAEFEEIKKHPEEGFVLLGKMSHIHPGTAYMVLEHHMRFDRKGYPNRGHDYRRYPNSHIVPVADTYDALTTMRSYQKARSPMDALETMRRLSARSLSPEYVAVMEKAMGVYPIGTVVRLSTMEVAIVTATDPERRAPSRLAVIVDRNGRRLSRPEAVDLMRLAGKASLGRRSIVATVNPLLYPPSPIEGYLRSAAM
ncbi:MAG: HD-GYP domain-containing protein, partial [Gemmatimonadota bacterium]